MISCNTHFDFHSMNTYYPTYKFHPSTVRKYNPETIRFETTRRIPNSHISKEDMVTAVFEAVADASLDLDAMQTREDVYKAVLSRIHLSTGVVNTG